MYLGVLEPHISAFCLFLLSLLLPYLVCITPSPKLSSSLLCGSHGATAVAQQVCGPLLIIPYYACVDVAYACVLCAMGVSVGVRVWTYLSVGTPRFSFIFYFVFSACCSRIMPSVSHRGSSSRALYFVAATVQLQSHSKFVWTTSIHVLAMHLRVCYDT